MSFLFGQKFQVTTFISLEHRQISDFCFMLLKNAGSMKQNPEICLCLQAIYVSGPLEFSDLVII